MKHLSIAIVYAALYKLLYIYTQEYNVQILYTDHESAPFYIIFFHFNFIK